MLSWWRGQPQANATRAVPDETISQDEPPETPAPVFAARAVKRAIFGTPAPPSDDEDEDKKKTARKLKLAPITRDSLPRSGPESPTKAGILMTPGTAAAKRKTVTFGSSVLDNEEKNGTSRSGIPNDCPGKFPSPWTPKSTDILNLETLSQSRRTTPLTKTLQESREKPKLKRSVSEENTGATPKLLRDIARDLDSQVLAFDIDTSGAFGDVNRGRRRQRSISPTKTDVKYAVSEGQQTNRSPRRRRSPRKTTATEDVTTDVEDPKSTSGKFWKKGFEVYHAATLDSIQKAMKYKDMAKLYAKSRDARASELEIKLDEQKRKVGTMLEEISQIAEKVEADRKAGKKVDASELMQNISRQTTAILRYKEQVDQFEATMRIASASASVADGVKQPQLPDLSKMTKDQMLRELQDSRQQLSQMRELRSEMEILRLNVAVAEKKASRLQLYNEELHEDLAQVKLDLERSEKRRKASEEHAQSRDDMINSMREDYDTLKENAKSQRRDAEKQLKRRADQVAEFRKKILALETGLQVGQSSNPSSSSEEIRALKGELAIMEKVLGDVESEKNSSEELVRTLGEEIIRQDKLVEEYKLQIQELQAKAASAAAAIPSWEQHKPRRSSSLRKVTGSASQQRERSEIDTADDRIPERRRTEANVLEQRRSPTKSQSSKSAVVTSTTPRSERRPVSQSAFRDMLNEASMAQDSPSAYKTSYTPKEKRRTHQPDTLSSQIFDLPSTTPQTTHKRRSLDSPRPSMAYMPSSPPKRIPARATSKSALNEITNNPPTPNVPERVSSASMTSTKAKSNLPPERAAAAKARIEQRRKMMDLDKENVKVY